jgi:hypothetical protein
MQSHEHRIAMLESDMRKLTHAMSIHHKKEVKNLQEFTINLKEIERLKRFAKRKKDNIVLKVIGTGLGAIVLIKTQTDFNKENMDGWVDITDYSCM